MPTQTQSQERITYLIITAPGCESSVSELVKHRQNQGENIKLVKSRDIITNSNGSTPGYKQLWNYLSLNQKPMEFTHVLLVGDVNDIPMPKLYPEDNIDQPSYSPVHYGPLYSDFYYQVLGIDWDKDKDGRLGEPSDDGIIPIPTVSVGRIPFSEPATIKKICDRIVGYDNSSFRRSILQAASVYLYDREENDPTNIFTDGSDMMEVIWADILQKSGFTRKTMYEAEGFRPKNKPRPRSDKDLNSTNLLQMVSEMEFGIVNILAHGEPDKVNRKVWESDSNGNGYPDGAEIKRPDLLTAEQVFGKTIRSSVVVSTACSSASIVGGAASLGSTMLRQGAGAYIGATAINYFIPGWSEPDDGGNQTITYNLMKHYCQGESLGWSLATTMKEFYSAYAGTHTWAKRWAQNVYSYILLGDPLMRLDPLEPKTVMPMSFNPTSISIQAGKDGQTILSFGISSSKDELSLDYKADSRFKVTFLNIQPPLFSNRDIPILVSAPGNMPVGEYVIEVSCDSRSHYGKATFGVRVTAPPSVQTQVLLTPEYVYAKPGQEFWIDLIVKPSMPVMSISGILQYDPALLELVDKRLGDFATFDYLCPQWQVVDNKQTRQITFSFFRNNEKIGATSTDVAFSFCFKGKKESISNLDGLSFDIKTPEKKSHIIPDMPSSRIKIHSQGLYLTVSSKSNPSNDRQVTLTGTAPLNQLLTINDKVITLTSDGKYSVQLDLTRFRNDIVMKVSNLGGYDGSTPIPVDRTLFFRKTVIWPSRKELAFRIGSKNVWNNGQCGKNLNIEPQVIGGSTMVPWRYISQELGFTVTYDEKTRKIKAVKNGTKIEMTIGQKLALVNGKEMIMSVPPNLKNGTTLVPLRFISDSIGALTGWLPQAKVATVFFPQ
ncbi:MAG: hypothetical protein HGA95_00640 [Caldiserica bacterium]|nr:hypothetical protein [Caldisericota bacterium]